MKLSFPALGALALLALVSLAVPAHAQAPAVAVRPTAPVGASHYDISEETTLSGTVSSVIKKPSAEMIMGAHLMVKTSSGTVDASLGHFAFDGKGALSVTPGQQVQVTGIMKTLKGQQVFVARTVKVDDEVYTLRNEHGLVVSPQARERLSQSSGQKGEKL
jgi:hypothetical protein